MWEDTLREKIHELARLADWASMVNLGRVRDHCRKAEYELKEELKFREEINAKKDD